MKIVLWGVGEYYKKYQWLIEQNEIVAVTDGNKDMWGNYIDENRIVAPQDIIDLEWDYIYITSTSIKPIYESILSLGIPEEKIRCYYDFIDTNRSAKSIQFNSGNRSGKNAKISLISQDLGVNGACRCLLIAAGVYIKNGYDVIVASPVDGIMRNEFLEIGCSIIIDQNLMISNLGNVDWLSDSVLVILNTLQMFYLLYNRGVNIPIIWWLHEPPYFYKCVRDNRLKEIDYSNVKVMPVSFVARNAFSSIVDNVMMEQLIYGMYDEYKKFGKENKETKIGSRIRFVTVGTIGEIKGVKFLVEAIQGLMPDIVDKCEFFIVGDDTSKYAEEVKDFCCINNLPVKFVGLLDHDKTMKIVSDSDVFLCSSKIESMSIAVEEAMMLEKPVIVPDTAGNTQFVIGENNGWIYKALNPDDLKEKIISCINNEKLLKEMGKRGRKVFKDNFEYSIFEHKMIELLKRNE